MRQVNKSVAKTLQPIAAVAETINQFASFNSRFIEALKTFRGGNGSASETNELISEVNRSNCTNEYCKYIYRNVGRSKSALEGYS